MNINFFTMSYSCSTNMLNRKWPVLVTFYVVVNKPRKNALTDICGNVEIVHLHRKILILIFLNIMLFIKLVWLYSPSPNRVFFTTFGLNYVPVNIDKISKETKFWENKIEPYVTKIYTETPRNDRFEIKINSLQNLNCLI